MPKGIHASKRGPKPAGEVSRNPASQSRVYLEVRITRPVEPTEGAAIARFLELTPDQRLAAVVYWADNQTEEI
jgi:hypothetical protein